jgi:hypothetical protein
MEPISLAIMSAAAGRAVDSLLGDQANKFVATIVGGVIGNQADHLVCGATRASWNFFRNLRSEDPVLNHDLERGTREAYLLATLELLRQAEHRVEVSGARLLGAGDAEALTALRRGAETDLRDVSNTLPEPLPDTHLFLIDPALAPAERLARMRATLRTNLARDLARWCPGRDVPPIVETLLETGWTIDTKFRSNVQRDWYSLIALAFTEKLKTAPRLAVIFESKMLALIAAREPAAAAIGSVNGLSVQLNQLLVPLQHIEDRLGILGHDVSEIKDDVKDIKRSLDLVASVPKAVWAATIVLVIATAVGFATNGLPRLACNVPGVRSACRLLHIGGVPSVAEAALWAKRQPGDCATLRTYLERFPSGAYADEAANRLAARRTEERQTWHPEEKDHILAVRSSPAAMTSEQAARADAKERAQTDAQIVCGPYQAGNYRLISTRVEAREWRCSRRADGIRCGFDGVVTCRVDARRVDLADVCY